MRTISVAPDPGLQYSPVYVIGGYRFRVGADRQLTMHDAIGQAARALQSDAPSLRKDVVNMVSIRNEF
jgi:hypothetical protein